MAAPRNLRRHRIYRFTGNGEHPGLVVRRDCNDLGLQPCRRRGLPAANDLRTFEQQARLATIEDPRLRQEASDFFSECYVPARSKYQAERLATTAVTATLSTYGEDDPDWMGRTSTGTRYWFLRHPATDQADPGLGV